MDASNGDRVAATMAEDPRKPVKPSPIGLAIMASGLIVIGLGLVSMGFVRRGYWLFGIPIGALMLYAGFKTAMKS